MTRPPYRARNWPSTWTWCAPNTLVKFQGGRSQRGWTLRRRIVDYALYAEPRMPAEVLRRGFLEGA